MLDDVVLASAAGVLSAGPEDVDSVSLLDDVDPASLLDDPVLAWVVEPMSEVLELELVLELVLEPIVESSVSAGGSTCGQPTRQSDSHASDAGQKTKRSRFELATHVEQRAEKQSAIRIANTRRQSQSVSRLMVSERFISGNNRKKASPNTT